MSNYSKKMKNDKNRKGKKQGSTFKKIMTLKLNSTKGEQTMQDNKTSKMADDGNTSGSAAKKVYLRVASISGDVANRALALVQIFPGKVPFVFYETVSKKYISTGLFVSESDFVLNELSEIGGKDNVVVR